MKIKTSELIDQALDWAVAKCEGKVVNEEYRAYQGLIRGMWGSIRYKPSTSWAQGGPIIERGHIHTWTDRKDAAYAGHPDSYWVAEMTELGGIWWGPTPLIAAMRCYVASKLGDEVEVPAEFHNTI